MLDPPFRMSTLNLLSRILEFISENDSKEEKLSEDASRIFLLVLIPIAV